jgi:hypothetical protein
MMCGNCETDEPNPVSRIMDALQSSDSTQMLRDGGLIMALIGETILGRFGSLPADPAEMTVDVDDDAVITLRWRAASPGDGDKTRVTVTGLDPVIRTAVQGTVAGDTDCAECGSTFPSEDEALDHMDTVHPEWVQEPLPFPVGDM